MSEDTTAAKPFETALRAGDIVAGKYRVEGVIGQGGGGVVVAATHVDLLDRVALKLLRADQCMTNDVLERFLREARALRRLSSPNVVRLHDVGRLETGLPYIAMEHLDGQNLRQLTKRFGALPIEQAVGCVRQALHAIAEAHDLGIVHRDLKPSNLFLSRRDGQPASVKVIDFGISKVNTEADAGEITGTAEIMGSPHFMSPEQMRSTRDVDARTDIWSLGVVLYRLLTGERPFDGSSAIDICLSVVSLPVAAPSTLRPELPAELDALVMRCLEKEPGARFATAAALDEALAPFAADPAAAVAVLGDDLAILCAEEVARRELAAERPPPSEAELSDTVAAPIADDTDPEAVLTSAAASSAAASLPVSERVPSSGAAAVTRQLGNNESSTIRGLASDLKVRRGSRWQRFAGAAVLLMFGGGLAAYLLRPASTAASSGTPASSGAAVASGVPEQLPSTAAPSAADSGSHPVELPTASPTLAASAAGSVVSPAPPIVAPRPSPQPAAPPVVATAKPAPAASAEPQQASPPPSAAKTADPDALFGKGF